MRVLDLFCGAGGAGMGYHLAWPDAEIVGVDVRHEPRYPFTFAQGDALTFPLDGFDFVHASPPCQAHTTLNKWRHVPKLFDPNPDLIEPIRERLIASGIPYAIENVVGASRKMPGAIVLSGGMFGLGVDRPRLFETSYPVGQLPERLPIPDAIAVYGEAADGRWVYIRKDGSRQRVAKSLQEGSDAMGGMPWMNWHELRESIPPAYTQFLAERFDAWRSSQPGAVAVHRHTAGTSAHRCADADVLPHTSRTGLSEAVPSPASQESVGGEFGQLQLGAGELLSQLPLVPSLGMGGGGAGDIGAVLELSGVDHKTSQPQTLESVNHKLGGAA